MPTVSSPHCLKARAKNSYNLPTIWTHFRFYFHASRTQIRQFGEKSEACKLPLSIFYPQKACNELTVANASFKAQDALASGIASIHWLKEEVVQTKSLQSIRLRWCIGSPCMPHRCVPVGT